MVAFTGETSVAAPCLDGFHRIPSIQYSFQRNSTSFCPVILPAAPHGWSEPPTCYPVQTPRKSKHFKVHSFIIAGLLAKNNNVITVRLSVDALKPCYSITLLIWMASKNNPSSLYAPFQSMGPGRQREVHGLTAVLRCCESRPSPRDRLLAERHCV